MRMDKLTSKFQMALADAQSLAVGNDHQFIEPVHLMKALLDQKGSVSSLLKQVNVDVPVYCILIPWSFIGLFIYYCFVTL